MARERNGQGANWPGSYWPIRSWERMGPEAKRLGTTAPHGHVDFMSRPRTRGTAITQHGVAPGRVLGSAGP